MTDKIKPTVRGKDTDFEALSEAGGTLEAQGYTLREAVVVHNPYDNGPVWVEVWEHTNKQAATLTCVKRSNKFDVYIT